MTTSYTSLLGLALPVTGELSGTWGDTVNNSITSLLDSAISGTTTISTDADITLSTTTGAANEAREAILLWTAGGTVTRNITAPAQSKTYIVINKSSSTQSIVLRGVGPTTGVTIIKGESAVCAWNGSDFIKVSNISGAGTFSSITNTGLTSGRVVYSTTGGLETDSANLLYSGTDLTVYGLTVGRGAGAISTNTAVGSNALGSNTSGADNNAFGSYVLQLNTTGNANTGFGGGGNLSESAFRNNTTGSYSSAFGVGAFKSNTTGSNGVAVGYQALYSNTTASANTALGYQALYSNTTASRNTAVGYQAGYANTTGQITAVGTFVLQANTTGSGNSAFGGNDVSVAAALNANTTGSNNVAVGTGALSSNTTASQSTAVGYQALTSHTTAGGNTAIGYQAMQATTTGGGNVGVGSSVLSSNTTGGNNSAFGVQALYSNTTGSRNAAFGLQALQASTTADNNTAFGYFAGYSNTTASNNTAVGYQSLYANTTGSPNVAVGYQALLANTTGYDNVAVGPGSLKAVTTSHDNTAIGFNALAANVTIFNNVAIGSYALAVFTGNGNVNEDACVAVGQGALQRATTGIKNTAIGTNSMANITSGLGNTAVGDRTMEAATTGNNNIAIGRYTMLSGAVTGNNNIAIGTPGGSGNSAMHLLTSGNSNVAVGSAALGSVTTGSNNTAIGGDALQANTTASNNTAVGYQAGYSQTIGTQNVYLGTSAGYSDLGTGSVFIGHQAGYTSNVGANVSNGTVAIGYKAGYSLTTGTQNTFIGPAASSTGYGSGYFVTTGSKNVIIGQYTGQAAPISQTGSNYIVLSDGDGNVRQTINSSGYVGMGTTSPIRQLTVSFGGAAEFVLQDTTQAANSRNWRIYNASNSLVMGTLNDAGSSGNDYLKIDSSGNVGIGTTSPGYKLDVQSSASTGAPLLANFQSAGGDTQLYVYNGTVKTQLTADNTYSASIVGSLSAHPLIIRTSNTERMRIDTNGNVFINNTGFSSGKFQLYQNAGGTSYAQQIFWEYASGTGYFIEFLRRNSGSNNAVGTIQASTTNVSYNTSSDYRLKEDIAPMTGALAKVAALKPVTYKWKIDGSDGEGFLAHELQEICPHAATGEKDGVDENGNPRYQGIDTSFLVATLTAAIQELKAEFDAYKSTHP